MRQFLVDALQYDRVLRNADSEAVWAFWCALRDAATAEEQNEIAKSCPNINMIDEAGHSVLYYAIEYKRNDIVKTLIKNGANVNLKNILKGGESLIKHACYGFDVDLEIVQTLLDADANISARDTGGQTPLMYAVRKVGNKAIVQLLLARGASVHDKDRNNVTVLMFACLGGDIDIVRLCLEKHARTGDKDKCKRTALDFATTKEIKDLLKNYSNRLNKHTIYKMYQYTKNLRKRIYQKMRPAYTRFR